MENQLLLNQSSIYNSFGSKQQFFNTVLDRYQALASAVLIKPLQDADAGIDSLEAFFSNLADWITRDGRRGCMLISLASEDNGLNPEFNIRVKNYMKRVTTSLQLILDRAVERNEISAGENKARATLLTGLTLGMNIVARTSSSRTDLDALIDAIQKGIAGWRLRPASRDANL